MFHARVRETSTTTGIGPLTLAGAVTQCQAFSDRVPVGDPVEYAILDADGIGWETGEGTLTSSTTVSRDTVHQSSNSDALINLSAGTHQVFLDWSHNAANKALYASDLFIDHIITGLELPSSSGTLTGSISAGIALVAGNRVKKGLASGTFPASSDTYVDLDYQGTYVFTAVANGAGAPAIAPNALRLGYIVTDATTITSSVSGASDSNGHWMGNKYRSPLFIAQSSSVPVSIVGDNSLVTLTLGNVSVDNVDGHSPSVNPSRYTVMQDGVYLITLRALWAAVSNGTFSLLAYKNGGSTSLDKVAAVVPSGSFYPASGVPFRTQLSAGDYLEFKGQNNSGSAKDLYPVISVAKEM